MLASLAISNKLCATRFYTNDQNIYYILLVFVSKFKYKIAIVTNIYYTHPLHIYNINTHHRQWLNVIRAHKTLNQNLKLCKLYKCW